MDVDILKYLTFSCKSMNEICSNCGELKRCHCFMAKYCDMDKKSKFASFKDKLYVTK